MAVLAGTCPDTGSRAGWEGGEFGIEAQEGLGPEMKVVEQAEVREAAVDIETVRNHGIQSANHYEQEAALQYRSR